MAFDFHPILEAGDNPRPNQWYVVSPEGADSCSAPCQRVGACANFVAGENGEGGRVLISAGAAPEGLCSDIHELFITKDALRWRKVDNEGIPARYEHASFTLGSDLFLFAGAQTTGPLNDIWKYQYSSSRWTVVKGKGSIPPPRTYHSNTNYWCREKGSTGQFLVFSGGAVGTTPVKDRKVYKFDPATGEWTTPTTSGTPPTPRQGHIVAVVGNKMFVHGGMSGQQIFNDLYALNLDKWVWSRLKVNGGVSPSLAAHGCAVLGARLYLFGGLTPNGSASDQLYCLHTDSLMLEKVEISGPPPPARLDHAMCTVYLPTTPATTTGDNRSKKSATAEGTPSSSCERGGSVADRAPHTVTVISPEGAANFSLLSDSDSTPQATSNPGCTPPTDSQSSGSDGPGLPPKVDITPSKPKAGEPVAASDNQGLSESSCTAKLDRLSLYSGMDTESRASTALGKVVPALFVFGGMDTQETVHGDAFIFVP